VISNKFQQQSIWYSAKRKNKLYYQLKAQLPHNAKQIDVSVVHGKIDKSHARAAIYPAMSHQVINETCRRIMSRTKVLHVPTTAVGRYKTCVTAALQLAGRLVRPSTQ
jgi:hypothetical protein